MSKIYGLTNAGVNLIRRAREENGKVSISRVLLSSQYEAESVVELFGHSIYFYDLGEAIITGVNASQSLSVGISLPDSPNGALVKSFAVFATYGGKEVMLYAESDANSALILGGAPYTFTASMSLNASDVVDNFGEFPDVDVLAQQVNALGQQVTASEQQIDTLGQQVTSLEQQVTASGQQIDTLGQQVNALAQQIAGEYISQVSYDEETGVMSFKSQDGSRQIDLNLA